MRRVTDMGGRADKVTALGTRGYFDRIVVLPGRIIFVELKRPRGGVWAVHQRIYMETYKALGAEVALIKNTADIDRLLGAHHTPF